MSEFQEYPKWVKVEGGDDVLVQTAEQEAALTAETAKPATKKPA